MNSEWLMAVHESGKWVGVPSGVTKLRASNPTIKNTNGRGITEADKPEILRVHEETGNLMETARQLGWSDSQVKRVVYGARN